MSKAAILCKMDAGISELLFQTHHIIDTRQQYVDIDDNDLHEKLVDELKFQKLMLKQRDPIRDLEKWIRDIATAGDIQGHEGPEYNTVKFTMSIFRCGLDAENLTVMSPGSASVELYYNKITQQAWSNDPEFSKLVRAIHDGCPSVRIAFVARRTATKYTPQIVAAAVWSSGTGLSYLTIEEILEMVTLDADVLITTSALYYRPFMHSNILIMVVMDGIRTEIADADSNVKHISLKVMLCRGTFERTFERAVYNFENSIESIDTLVDMTKNEPFALIAEVETNNGTRRLLTWSGIVLTEAAGDYKAGIQLHRLTVQENKEFNFTNEQQIGNDKMYC